MTFRINGIILQIKNYRESDKILVFYSNELGKINILVRGARKIKSKLVGLCQPFVLYKLTIVSGKNFYHLIGGESKNNFLSIGQDFTKIKITNSLLKLIDKLIRRNKRDKTIFALIIKTLQEIDKTKERTELIASIFILKLLSFLGYRPEIKHCLVCGAKSFNPIYFNFSRGGIVCPKCYEPLDCIEISQDTLYLLQNMLYKKYEFLRTININRKDFKKVKKIIKKFLIWHVYPVRSKASNGVNPIFDKN